MRGWGHGQIDEVFSGGSREGGSHGVGALGRVRIAVGGDRVDGVEAWLHGGNVGQVGTAGGAGSGCAPQGAGTREPRAASGERDTAQGGGFFAQAELDRRGT